MGAHLDFYEDESGEYRWRLVAGNGKIVAEGGEGFERERDVVRSALRANELLRLAVHAFTEPEEESF